MTVLRNAFLSFIRMESFSSILLFFSAAAALILANSSLSETYFAFLQTKVGLTAGEFSLYKPLILWINDGLMAVFFFLIGLEIKREIMAGELRTLRKSALPIVAAVGGMVFPVIIFLIFNDSGEAARGWGIPMATDIAFSLGILTLLGSRVPLSLKIFLTAFAIIDDLGAVLIIAFFYSSELNWSYIAISMGIYSILIILSIYRINARYLYYIAAVAIWYLFLKAGIHPTIAGVMMALVIPVNRKIGKLTFAQELRDLANNFENSKTPGIFLNSNQLSVISETEELVEKAQPYLQHLEHKLHPIVAFFVMPVFALANGGIQLAGNSELSLLPVAFHIGIALLAGKVIGISLFSYLGIKTGIAELPEGVNMKQIIGISFLGAVGFTMALFINNLAFQDPSLLNSAKIGIIVSSLFAGIAGYFILKQVLPASYTEKN